MERKLVRFFAKHQLQPSNILYITKADRHTEVTLKDGTVLTTTIPMKYFLPALPEGGYLNITKGVIVSSAGIQSIDGNVYTMNDGKTFVGRVRGAGEHKANRKALEAHEIVPNRLISETVFQQFSIMDNLQLPFAVVELVFDEQQHTLDFIVRYCNEAMASHQGQFREEMLDRPYATIMRTTDKKWALLYTEVALTGIPQIIQEIHPITGKPFSLHLFQPAKNLCACLLVE